jgi:chorismate dehydratase
MEKIKVTAVSYINTWPFIYGLEYHNISNQIDILREVPSVCTKRLKTGEAEVGLVPVATWSELPDFEPILEYGIAASGEVRTVLLVSNVPLNKISKIYLDVHSRTSVALVQVLAHFFWNIKPEYISESDNPARFIEGTSAAVIIGDKAFEIYDKFEYQYDLALEWGNFTGLPFVFAGWVARRGFSVDNRRKIIEALEFGTQHIREAIDQYYLPEHNVPTPAEVYTYLTQNIRFALTDDMHKAIILFQNYLQQLKENQILISPKA